MGYFAEYQKNKKEKNNSSGGSYYKQWRAENRGAELAADMQSRVQSWMDEHNAFLNDYSARFGGRNGDLSDVDYTADAQAWYDNASARGGALRETTDKLLEDLQRDSYIYGDDYVKAVSEMLTSGQDLYSGVADIAKSDVDFWAQFAPTQEQAAAGYDTAEKVYNAWRTESKYRTKHEGKSRDEINRAILYAEDEDEADWLRQRATELWTGQDQLQFLGGIASKLEDAKYLKSQYERLKKIGGDEYAAVCREIGSKYGDLKGLDAEISSLEDRYDAADDDLELIRYGNLINQEDFEQYSQYATTGQVTLDKHGAIENYNGVDPLYEYINNESFRQAEDEGSLIYGDDTVGTDSRSSYAKKGYGLLREDESAVYNYLYAKEGKEAANRYLELLNPQLEARDKGYTQKYWTDFSKEHPNLASAYSVASSLNSGFEHLGNVAGYFTEKALGNEDVELRTNRNLLITNTIRGTVSEQTNWMIGNWDAYDFLYNTAMSGVDSMAASGFGGLGGTVLGLSAAAQGTEDALARGMSNDQAFWNGMFTGVFEGLFETYSIGKFNALKEVSPKSVKDLFKNIGKSMLVNASEEALTEIANIGYDTLVNGEFANYTLEELQNGAWKDALGQVIEAGGSGALMGLGMGGIGSAVGYHNGNRQVKSNYGDSQTELVAEALEIDPDNAFAKQMRDRLDKGKNLSGSQLNRLVQQNEVAIGKMEGSAAEMQNTVPGDGVKYSIKRTQNMSWDQQITGALSKKGNILRNDTLVLDDTPAILASDGVPSRKLAVPLSVVTKAKSGKDASHSITDANLKDLQRGVRNAPIVINNPARNALVFVTDIQQDGHPVLAAFQQDTQFDGDDVHKATSIHLQMDVASMLKALPSDATIYVKNESELDTAVGVADSLRSLAANVKFTEGMVTQLVAGVNGENVDPVAQLARETVEARYAAEDGVGVDGISAEGKAIYQDQAVDVVDIDTAGGGKVTVKLADGRSVDATALEYDDSGEAELWRVIGQYAEDVDSARALLQEYHNGDIDAYKYARGIEEAFLFGKLNLTPKEMEVKGSYVNLLDPAQRNMAYKQGKRAGQKKTQQTKQQQENIDAVYKQAKAALEQKGTDVGEHSVQLADGLTEEKMGRSQYASYELAKMIAPAVKADIRIYDGGKEWGYYDHKTDTICLNINAKWSGVSMMTFTLAHELVHRAKLGSLAKYQAFADFLLQQYGEQGSSVNAMVQQQLQAAEENGISMTYEEALEEVICDACQKMLVDTDAGKRLAEFGAKSEQNKNIVKQFGQWLKELMQKLRRIFRNVEPDSLAAQEFQKFDDNVKQSLADMFVDMSMDAGEKLSTIKAAGMTEKITTDEGGVKYKLPVERKAPTYQELVGKDPIRIVNIGRNAGGLSYADIKKRVLENANKKKVFDTPHLNRDTGVSIFLTPASYSHAFSNPTAEFGVDTLLAMDHITDIIHEAILTHIEAPKNPRKAESRVLTLFAAIKGENGVEPVKLKVKEYRGQSTAELPRNIREYFERNGNQDVHHRLYDAVALEVIAIEGAKKESGASASVASQKRLGAKGTPNSTIKIAELFNLVNGDAKKYIPQDETGKQYKLPAEKDAADRGMLVDLFEQMVTGSDEYKALQNYKKNIDQMLALEEKVDRLTEEIKRVSFAEGPRNMEYLNNLKQQRKQAVAELNRFDSILLGLEKSGVLRSMIERNRQMIQQESYRKAREYYREKNEKREAEIRQYYRESRRKAVERHNQAEVRQRIRKDVQRLDSLLNKGTKKKNVKMGLQDIVGAALRLAKGSFLMDYNEYDMIRNGLQNKLLPEEQEAFDRCRELLEELDELPEEPGADNIHDKWDPEQVIRRDDRKEALKRELYKNMRILRDGNVFQRERASAEDVTAEQLADELLSAYQKLSETEFEHLQGLYSVKVYDQIEKTRNFLKGKALKDMTAIELAELHKLYRMISETVSRADEMFGKHRNEKTSKRGNRMLDQLKTDKDADISVAAAKLKEAGWSLLTPEAAAAVIGAEELTQAIREIEATETVQQQDLEHARQYAAKQAERFNRKNWNTSKQVIFAGTEITIGQAMALFAYTERKAGRDHISGDGFVHSKAVPIEKEQGKLKISRKFIKDTTRAYRVTEAMYEELEKLLTPEQKGYVRAMRNYLAEVMGAKGNEVSRELYGIDMYGEKFYFPLKSAKDFLDAALGAKRGEVKVTNQGFTNPLQEGASNAIVLEDFESVWAKHVQEMSNYHATAVAMENFNRLYNYRRTEQRETTDKWGQPVTEEVKSSESVSLHIERRASGATWYLTRWMENVNGGVRSDATEKLLGGLLGNYRKTTVLGNLSVISQQPTSIIRAVPYLGKDFLAGWKTWKETTPAPGLIREMYRYCPVAGLKKMGGFDPSAGQTVRQYLFDGRDDAKNKLKKGIDKVNEILGAAPEKMDELAWSYLWLSCKKKTLRENRNLRAGSREHLEVAAELFTKIVRETQVYDSVMSKPLIMQSKSGLTKSLTSFLNEPLKALNQCITAVARAINGEITKREAAAHIACVALSNLLANAVRCLFYALRDDDEDETYWEKYVKHLSGGVLDVIIPLDAVPGLRDIVSIVQGYGNERSEFVIISDAWDGLQKLFKESKAKTPEELEKEVWGRVEGLGNVLNLSGVPVRNLVREVRGIYYTLKRAGTVQGTRAGMRYAAIEGLTGKEVAKKEQMANAVAEGDTEHIIRLMATYSSEDSAASAVRSAVKDAYLQGKVTEDVAVEFLQEYGGNDAADAWDKVTEWTAEKETGIAYDDIKESFISGKITEDVAVEFLQEYGGNDAADAWDKVTEWTAEKETGIAYDDIKESFISGKITEEQAKDMYITYGGHDEEDAEKKVTYWEFLKEHPESELDQSPALKFLEFAEPAGIDLAVYTQFAEATAGLESDKDEDGKTIANSKREKVWAEIHKLPISKKQKDALHYAAGYKESSLEDAPWH